MYTHIPPGNEGRGEPTGHHAAPERLPGPDSGKYDMI